MMRGALTSCRAQREGLVRTLKESDRARGTHILSRAEGGSRQDTERIRPREGHSHSVERRGRVSSGERNNPTARGALTACRAQREGLVRTLKESDRARGTHRLSSAEGGSC